MPLSPEEIKKRHMAMFGVEDIEEYYSENILDPIFGSHQMAAMSLLSDAQEEIQRGNDERARRLINIAKWVISQKLSGHA